MSDTLGISCTGNKTSIHPIAITTSANTQGHKGCWSQSQLYLGPTRLAVEPMSLCMSLHCGKPRVPSQNRGRPSEEKQPPQSRYRNRASLPQGGSGNHHTTASPHSERFGERSTPVSRLVKRTWLVGLCPVDAFCCKHCVVDKTVDTMCASAHGDIMF